MSLSRRSFMKKVGAVMAGAALAPVASLMSQDAVVAEEEEYPAFVYYYDPCFLRGPATIDFRAGAINYLMYGRERIEPLLPGRRTLRVEYVENPDV